MIDSFEFQHNGQNFVCDISHDSDMGAPWDEHDGHGIVSDWTTRDKKPGERVLCSDRNSKRFYNVQGTMRKAKREGWDAEPFSGTKGERAARAVEADFKNLQAWCNEEWYWVWINVYPKGFEDVSATLGGLTSNDMDSISQCAVELAEQCVYDIQRKIYPVTEMGV